MGTQVHPNTAIFALYGQYVLPRGGGIWLGSLIRAMGTLDFSEAAARSSALRMKKKGYLQSQRLGRRSFYWLTDTGLNHLNRGGFRFSISPDDVWDGRWTLVIYSIPEERRESRDALRNMLNWWGFGMLAPGTWISTHSLPSEAENKWRELGIREYLNVFRSEYLSPGDLSTVVARAFPQLSTLADHYRDHIAESESILRRFEADLLKDEECFAYRLRNICEFVPIILRDPSLPSSLLPTAWPRPTAQLLTQELQQTLAEPAERFFEAIYQAGEDDRQS
ncbi:MAG: PaaX family transcriptional regulator C-terminal domain-containing protein [Chloroflexota bacterium]|nr:PaaX family transcriptional regulator C-terminal domain-containing protein [Chloroflexota bacterium]